MAEEREVGMVEEDGAESARHLFYEPPRRFRTAGRPPGAGAGHRAHAATGSARPADQRAQLHGSDRPTGGVRGSVGPCGYSLAGSYARGLSRIDDPTLITDERLYLATAKAMLEVVQERGGNADHVMVVGHNPGITEFADGLSAERSLDNMPTCSAYTLRFDIKDWKHLDWRTGTDADFEYPGRAI